jgi:hypothetical protein
MSAGAAASPANLAALLARWAGSGGTYEVATVLERVVGRRTPPACAGLAAEGKTIVTIVDANASSERVRTAYGQKADVRVAGNDDVTLPKCDLVVIHGGQPDGDWRASILALGKYALKAVVVCVVNPGTWRAEASSLLARARARAGSTPPDAGETRDADWGATRALAPLLWEIGRVREHAFLEIPALGLRAPKLASRLAPLHAFVIDVTPRTPQARRRLRLETA